MRSVFLPLASFLLVGLVLLGQADTFPPSPKPSPQTPCTITGRVISASDGSPLNSAHVVLVERGTGREPKTYGATTESDGVFVLKNVAPGRYRFFATRAGYVTQRYPPQTPEGALLALRPGQEISEILFRLTPAAVITGRVSSEDGESLDDVRVTALRRPSDEEIQDESSSTSNPQDEVRSAGSAHTDDRGVYRIYGLKPGDYYLKARETLQPAREAFSTDDYFARQTLGTEYAPVFYPGVLQRNQAEIISLRAGEEVQIDFTLRHTRTVEISGRVLAPDGKPANAMVNLEEAGGNDDLDEHNTDTDANGVFTLKGVPPGSYVLTAYQQATDGVYRPTARQNLQVGNDNIESILIALQRGVDLVGRIIFEGPSSSRPEYINLSLRSLDGDVWGYGSRAKPDGTFKIDAVADGNYALVVHGPGNWYVKSARRGEADILAHGLDVEGGTGGTLEIVISSSTAQLEGSVIQDDKPVIGARVHISPDPETPYNRIRRGSTMTDQNGRFLLVGLAPGKYRVTANSPSVPGAEGATADPRLVTLSERQPETIQLKLASPQGR